MREPLNEKDPIEGGLCQPDTSTKKRFLLIRIDLEDLMPYVHK